MTIAAAAVMALPDAPWVRGALTGLQVAVVGLLAAALWHLARSEAGSALLSTVLLVGFAAGLFVNAAVVVAAAGIIGVVIDRVKRDA
jgi:chromate transport protein ChrA